MQFLVLVYCATLLVPVGLAWRAIRRRPRVWPAVAAVVGVACVAFALALTGFFAVSSTRWGGSLFLVLGLFAWGVFLHVPLTLVACALALRREHPRAARVATSSALVICAVYVLAFWIEPRRLQVTHYALESEHVTRPYRLLLVADIQSNAVGAYERRVLEAALETEPDLILLAGDYVQALDPDDYWEEIGRLNASLRASGLAAPLGAIAVEGNCERAGWSRVFAGLDVESVVETHSLERGELAVTGLSFRDGFDPGASVARRPGFHVVLAHAPDFALGDIEADLLLAGHTHGGQVRLPWIGPLITLSKVPRAWAAGRTELASGATLIVSRGLGMEGGHAPRLRFLCPPELVVIDVLPAPGP